MSSDPAHAQNVTYQVRHNKVFFFRASTDPWYRSADCGVPVQTIWQNSSANSVALIKKHGWKAVDSQANYCQTRTFVERWRSWKPAADLPAIDSIKSDSRRKEIERNCSCIASSPLMTASLRYTVVCFYCYRVKYSISSTGTDVCKVADDLMTFATTSTRLSTGIFY